MQELAFVNYHVKRQTPQQFRFDVDGIVGNLESPELVRTAVQVTNLRDAESSVDFDRDGILFTQAPTTERTFAADAAWRDAYDRSLETLLPETVGAKEVIVFDHTVRIDDPNAARKPARNVHNDYSTQGAKQRVIDLVGAELAQDYEAGHYAFINVWRPIDQPIKSSPLGFIRPATVAADDWMTIDLVYPDRVGQILGVAANDAHEWFYQAEMTPDEVVIFNIYDNRGRSHLAHSALDMPEPAGGHVLRKSVESRTLVRFE
ncbi:MAG: CmcJ/NvfI family oxidoreductase [Pseudomonadota bacterium]